MRAWVRKRIFNDRPHYSIEYRDHTGKRRTKSFGAGSNAHRLAKQAVVKLDAELRTGVYADRELEKERQAAEESKRMTWTQFVIEQYNPKEIELMPSGRSKPLVRKSLRFFGQLCDNPMLHTITADTISAFREKRSKAKGKKPGSTISRATVNSDLRAIKAALRAAAEWGYIEKAPKVKFLDEFHELPRYVTPEHFAAIFKACETATLPDEMHVAAGEWWRALLMFAQMTGWRISEILALKWADVNLEAGTALTRASDNKGKRDAVVALHPVLIDRIRPLKTFHPNVFPWEHDRTCLMKHLHAIQAAASIDLPCRVTGKTAAELAAAVERLGVDANKGLAHTCTTTCHRYGFHDLRRAFATMNAANMTREALQALMRHQSPLTTAGYINFAQQLAPAVANLHVPKVG
jgi:integrase